MSQLYGWQLKQLEHSIPSHNDVPAGWIYNFPFEHIDLLSKEAQIKVLACIRISFENIMSRARRELNPVKLYEHLSDMHELIVVVYLHSEVRKVAEQTKNGPQGPDDPYDFWPEMMRDASIYLMLVGDLINDPTLYLNFVDQLVARNSSRKAEKSLSTLVELEREIMLIKTYRTAGARGLVYWLENAVNASIFIGRYDRAASEALMCAYLPWLKPVRQVAWQKYALCVELRPELSVMKRNTLVKNVLRPIQRILFRRWMRTNKIDMTNLAELKVEI